MNIIPGNNTQQPFTCYICEADLDERVENAALKLEGSVYRLCLKHEDVFYLTVESMNILRNIEETKGKLLHAMKVAARGGELAQ